LLPKYGPRIVTTWAQFDGVHYLTIIAKGYKGTGLIQAFFPVYPLLVKGLTVVLLNPIIAGILLSTVSLALGLWLLYKLILLDDSSPIAKKTIALFLVMPVSFFFASIYTEGLFFLLVVASFYFARTNRWWLAGCIGILAAATRVTGIFLVPALFYDYWYLSKRRSVTVVSTFLPAVGLLGFMSYLYVVFHDPLLFIHVQDSFGASRSTDSFVLLHQVFYRYVRMFLTVPIQSRLFYTVLTEFLAGFLGLILLIFGWFSERKSYIVFAALCYVLPTLTGTFSSLPRYLLPLFPLYVVVVKRLSSPLYYLTVAVSFIMLVINVWLFTQGLWVA
jgi:Gpi18-like mannosyltransferase